MPELRFTEQARKQYKALTGPQKQFIDQGLDNLKLDTKSISQEIVQKELKMKIRIRREKAFIIVEEIIAGGFEKTKQNLHAIKRAKSWNN
ncbi:hypothetical protein [Lactobacillus sp. LL6]|uniref:hypothetical protein n=1 Tax=Lactobacillus sp. LL6 TaxID=2596827 RepID=UPI001186280B|nr:hypothetical protein [Lactobacillus sp. LL6]TSO26995.1 hypothetical protein FOD82_08230 [Lactobacillus sp. LL6]